MRGLDSRLAMFDTDAMRKQLEFAFFTARVSEVLLGAAGMLALLLALAGLYGVIAYVIAQRTHEIGVRLALGATAADVLTMILRHSLAIGGAGVAVGVLLAFGATRMLASLFYGIQPG